MQRWRSHALSFARAADFGLVVIFTGGASACVCACMYIYTYVQPYPQWEKANNDAGERIAAYRDKKEEE